MTSKKNLKTEYYWPGGGLKVLKPSQSDLTLYPIFFYFYI